MGHHVTPVARARRATQRTYLDGVYGTRGEGGDGYRTGFGEDARCLKRTTVLLAPTVAAVRFCGTTETRRLHGDEPAAVAAAVACCNDPLARN